jgi:hypothetical protein
MEFYHKKRKDISKKENNLGAEIGVSKIFHENGIYTRSVI